jgi:hypothetical protein
LNVFAAASRASASTFSFALFGMMRVPAAMLILPG